MAETNELSQEQEGLFKKLTRLQQKTVIGVLGGLTQVGAYRQAGGGAKTDKAATTAASVMLSNVNVKAFMDSVLLNWVTKKIMEREEGLERLTKVARIEIDELDLSDQGDKAKLHYSMEAIKQLRAIEGWDKARQHEISGPEVVPLTPKQDIVDVAKQVLLLLHKATYKPPKGRVIEQEKGSHT